LQYGGFGQKKQEIEPKQMSYGGFGQKKPEEETK